MVWELIKDYVKETGEVIDGMKVYELKKPMTKKELELLTKSKDKKRKSAFLKIRKENFL